MRLSTMRLGLDVMLFFLSLYFIHIIDFQCGGVSDDVNTLMSKRKQSFLSLNCSNKREIITKN